MRRQRINLAECDGRVCAAADSLGFLDNDDRGRTRILFDRDDESAVHNRPHVDRGPHQCRIPG